MIKLKKYLFYLTIFVNGAVILILEILGTRILAPFYGSTIFVWSSLITITMASLALGYFLGGKIADEKPDIDLLYWIILIVGLSVLIVPAIDDVVLLRTDSLGIRLGPLVSAFFLFFLPLVFLGMVSPFCVRLETKLLDNLGTNAGNLYALSTIGSLFGSLLAGFYLVPIFSIKFVMNILSLTLFLLFLSWQVLKLLKKP